MKLYYIYRKSLGSWGFIQRMKASSPNMVRIILAESGYEGSFMWHTGKGHRKEYYANFVR